MMKLLTLFLGLISLTAHSTVPLPSGLLEFDDYLEVFRGQLRTKINDLANSYIVDIKNSSQNADSALIQYRSSQIQECAHVPWPAGHIMTEINRNVRRAAGEVRESVEYLSCFGQVEIKEELLIRGKNPQATPLKQFLAGERTLNLKEGEDWKWYRLSDGQQELFSIQIKREASGMSALLAIRGVKFLTIRYDFLAELSRVTYRFHDFAINYQRKYSQWNFGRNYVQNSAYVNAFRSPRGKVDYILRSGHRVSLNTFQTHLQSDFITGGPLELVRQFVKYLLTIYPNTSTASGGVRSSRFLDELRNANTRLLNNIELNLVRNLIQSYIKAIESGDIVVDDRRPDE